MRLMTASVFIVLLSAGCHGPERPAIQDLAGSESFSLFRLISLRGARDGDRLKTQATFSDSSSILRIELHFAVGSPTTLDSGLWHWARGGRAMSGTVTARSITFLGGQTVLPSVGGTFDLDANGAARYRVTIPVQQLAPLPNSEKNWLEVNPPAGR
jgi:hypothetical protein